MIGSRDSQRLAFSASLNDTRRNGRQIERLSVVKGTTVSFTAAATIADSGNGMAAMGVGDLVEVRGSASNSRVFRPSSAAVGSLTVVPAHIATIAAGPVITLVRR